MSYDAILALTAGVATILVALAYRGSALVSASFGKRSPLVHGLALFFAGTAPSGVLLLIVPGAGSADLFYVEFGSLLGLTLLSVLLPRIYGNLTSETVAAARPFFALRVTVELGWLVVIVLQVADLFAGAAEIGARVATSTFALLVVFAALASTLAVGRVLVGVAAMLSVVVCWAALTVFIRPDSFSLFALNTLPLGMAAPALMALAFFREFSGVPQQWWLGVLGSVGQARRAIAVAIALHVVTLVVFWSWTRLGIVVPAGTASGLAGAATSMQLLGSMFSGLAVAALAGWLLAGGGAIFLGLTAPCLRLVSGSGLASLRLRFGLGAGLVLGTALMLGYFQLLRGLWSETIELTYGLAFALLLFGRQPLWRQIFAFVSAALLGWGWRAWNPTAYEPSLAIAAVATSLLLAASRKRV